MSRDETPHLWTPLQPGGVSSPNSLASIAAGRPSGETDWHHGPRAAERTNQPTRHNDRHTDVQQTETRPVKTGDD